MTTKPTGRAMTKICDCREVCEMRRLNFGSSTLLEREQCRSWQAEWIAGVEVPQMRLPDREPVVIKTEPKHEFGPGTILKELLAMLDIVPDQNCNCLGRMLLMNEWGSKGCRERKAIIVEWLREGQVKWGWSAKLHAAALVIRRGLAFRLNVLDPFGSLVEEAIRRAEQEGF